MQKLTMQEACKKLHWHDSSASYLKLDKSAQELTIELELCDCEIDDSDDILFNGQSGTLFFHGVSNYSLEPEHSSEQINLEFLSSEYLKENEQEGLLLWGISWLNIPAMERDYSTLRIFADYATWHPKTNNE